MKSKIIINSDTCSSLTVDEGIKEGIIINPLYVKMGDEMLEDTIEISAQEFYERVINENLTPSTSQPSIEKVRENYKKYSNKQIINITPSAGLSGTNNGAHLAAEGLDNVYVYDSKTIAAAQRYLVLKANRLAQEGHDLQYIIEQLDISKNNTRAFMMPLDFSFLVRGGRLSRSARLLLGLLRIKPILTLSEDRNSVDRYTFSMTLKKAIDQCFKAMKKDLVDETYKVYILHANNLKLALDTKKRMEEEFQNLDIEVLVLPPVLGCHAGPGTLVIQYIKK